jgi:hypothetical protein
VTLDGYWFDNWIYWVTQLLIITVYTLYNSQQLSLFSSSEDFGSKSATTLMASLAITILVSRRNSVPYSNWSKSKSLYDRRSVKSSIVAWRHHRNGPQRKHRTLPLLRCLATVVNKRFHCWLLTDSVHVTLRNSPLINEIKIPRSLSQTTSSDRSNVFHTAHIGRTSWRKLRTF